MTVPMPTAVDTPDLASALMAQYFGQCHRLTTWHCSNITVAVTSPLWPCHIMGVKFYEKLHYLLDS